MTSSQKTFVVIALLLLMKFSQYYQYYDQLLRVLVIWLMVLLVVININSDNISEVFIYTLQTEDWAPMYVEGLEAAHEWMNDEWMLSIIQDICAYNDESGE